MITRMKKLICFFTVALGIVSCVPRSVLVKKMMSPDEVTQVIDSLCRLYYVNADMNTDYIRTRFIPESEKRGLENVVLRHSPLKLGAENIAEYSWEDSIGSFVEKRVETEKDKIRIKDLRDSIFISHPSSFFFSAQSVIIDNHEVNFAFSFHNMYPNKEQAQCQNHEACIIDNERNDTTYLEVMNHRWSIMRNPPLVVFQVFDLKIDSCYYTVHMITDRRLLTSNIYKEYGDKTINYYKIKNFKIEEGEDYYR